MFETLSSEDIRALTIVAATIAVGWFLIMWTITLKGRK